MSKSPPNIFLRMLWSIWVPSHEHKSAARHPLRIAGQMFLRFKSPLRQRNRLTAPAATRKNMRLMALAVEDSVPATKVSHRISNDPPPTPNPAKNPRISPTEMENRGVSINIGYLRTKSKFQEPGEAISPGFLSIKYRQVGHPAQHPPNTAMQQAKEDRPSPETCTEKQSRSEI